MHVCLEVQWDLLICGFRTYRFHPTHVLDLYLMGPQITSGCEWKCLWHSVMQVQPPHTSKGLYKALVVSQETENVSQMSSGALRGHIGPPHTSEHFWMWIEDSSRNIWESSVALPHGSQYLQVCYPLEAREQIPCGYWGPTSKSHWRIPLKSPGRMFRTTALPSMLKDVFCEWIY